MTSNFKYDPVGDLDDYFMTDPAMIDRYVGNQLWMWGLNSNGQLGANDITHRSSPVQTVAGGTNWKQINCGGNHVAAIKTDGTLWLWGRNTNGQLGDNSITHRSSPVQTVAGGTNWKQVAAGTSSTAAIKTDGTLWTWGSNYAGQLGANDITHRSSPVQTVSGGTDWKQVDCGHNHMTAIKTDGTLWLWGRNSRGPLGANDITHRSSPVQTVSGGTDWKLVRAGYNRTAAIKTDGTLWLWGNGSSGNLGDNSLVHKSSPVQTVAGGTNWKDVSMAGDRGSTAAIKTDGTLWMWGYNFYGSIGDNTRNDKSSPVQTVAGGTDWKQVSAGTFQTVAVKTDGTLWTWGRNDDAGQLGDNTVSSKSSPIQTVAGGNNWKSVSCGYSNMAAITYTES